MDVDARLKALARLAQSKTGAASAALEKEMNQVCKTLETELEYDVLEQGLDILNTIGYRVSERAVAVLDAFTQTIETRKLLHTRAEQLFAREMERYNNAQTLLSKAVEVLVHLRYYQTSSVLRILLRLSTHSSERLRKKVSDGLAALANYDLDVFYGPDRSGGIGAAPQEEIISFIETQSDEVVQTNYEASLTLLQGLLSPSIEGASWSSSAVVLSRGATPALPSVAAIRERSIRVLRRMYGLAATNAKKLHVINALHDATQMERHESSDLNMSEMILRDATDVLAFYAELVPIEDLQIVQKIEHNSYWIFVHGHREEIRTAARSIERLLAAHDEYQIYRVLIGFEGIFGDWGTLQKSDSQWDIKEKERKEKALDLAKKITFETYPEWRKRILTYAQTESDDLATFPIFYYFLDEFAATHADLALRLVTDHTANIARFLIPLLRGLWDGPQREATRALVMKWVEHAQAHEDNYLFVSTKLFLSTRDIDVSLLGSLLDKAVEIKDAPAIRQVVAVAIVRYPAASTNSTRLKQLLFRALDVLTRIRDASWVFDAWFRSEAQQVLDGLEPEDFEHILQNLHVLPRIDYHAEELLARIAQRVPERVVEFFCERIRVERDGAEVRRAAEFEAVPFEFHKLQEPLSKLPHAAVRIVLAQFRDDPSLFAFRGARLLRNIFPKITEDFEAELLQLIQEGGEKHHEFVLGVLRNYHGELFVHRLCKEIVRAVPEDSPLRSEVAIALETTGVVSGEFGMAEAYERKRQEVLPWLTDADERVRAFAKWYIEDLERMRDAERKRAEEEIVLRKFRYREE